MKSLFVCILMIALTGLIALAVVRGYVTPNVAGDPSGENKILTSEKDFRDKVTELRIQRDKVVSGIKRLEIKKKETLDHLKAKGVKSSKDVTDDPDIMYALRNLKGWKTEIDNLKEDVSYYDEAIASIEAMLDEIERERIEKSVALTDDQYFELRKIVKDLNERLGIEKKDLLAEEELIQLLDEEMEKENAGQ